MVVTIQFTNTSPCKGCKKKYIGCHSKCDDYIAYDNWRKEIRKKRTIDAIVTSIANERFKKSKGRR